MKTIKISKKEYTIKPGDYVQDNGVSLLLCSGDNRVLRLEGSATYDYIRLTKKAAKELNYISLPVKYTRGFGGTKLKIYTF